MIIPNIWENKNCSKPPTRYGFWNDLEGDYTSGRATCAKDAYRSMKSDMPKSILLRSLKN